MGDSEELKYWHDFIGGDFDALSVLFRHYAKSLVSYGMKISPDKELVKDSIQEVFIQLIQKRLKLKRNDEIRGLVFRLLRNKMIDEIKLINRNKRTGNLIFNCNNNFETDAEHRHIGSEDELRRDRLLTSALDELSAHQKEAMFLKYSSGFSYEQISEVMDISIASVRTLIYRTLKQLRAIMLRN
jgi:RNA polymerase sigma factor (sigma-70 family)